MKASEGTVNKDKDPTVSEPTAFHCGFRYTRCVNIYVPTPGTKRESIRLADPFVGTLAQSKLHTYIYLKMYMRSICIRRKERKEKNIINGSCERRKEGKNKYTCEPKL